MFFFFKQKTAYELLRSLVGSDMCIRDRCRADGRIDAGDPALRDGYPALPRQTHAAPPPAHTVPIPTALTARWSIACLLYTSDAADDLICVHPGGRRIIKKNKKTQTQEYTHHIT